MWHAIAAVCSGGLWIPGWVYFIIANYNKERIALNCEAEEDFLDEIYAKYGIDLVDVEYHQALAEDVVEWVGNITFAPTHHDLQLLQAQREFEQAVHKMKMSALRFKWTSERYRNIS